MKTAVGLVSRGRSLEKQFCDERGGMKRGARRRRTNVRGRTS